MHGEQPVASVPLTVHWEIEIYKFANFARHCKCGLKCILYGSLRVNLLDQFWSQRLILVVYR